MIEKGEEEQAFTKYPRTFIQYGEKLKAMIHQKKDQLKSDGHPHIWLYGTPGSGKSAVLSFIYPNTYREFIQQVF